MKELASFLERFVRPLVAGGDLHVGPPLDARRLEAWATELEAGAAVEEAGAIDDVREAIAAELVVRPPRLVLGRTELRLAAALYDALVLQHPRADAWTVPAASRRRLREIALALAGAEPPGGRRELLERHTLLHNLFDLTRVDVEVRWWTGRAEFQGERPPRRLTRWPTLRRVRVAEEVVRADELLAAETASGVVERLLSASPLTDLLSPDRRAPAFSFARTVAVLRDPELARAAAYRWLEADDERLERIAAAAVAAWERLLGSRAPAADVRAATAFLVHVAALLAAREATPGGLEPAAPLAVDAGADVGAGAPREHLRLLLALPDVAGAADPALGAPPGVDHDVELAKRWRAQRESARPLLADARVKQLGARLASRI